IAGNSKPLIRINPTRGPPYYIVECSPGKFIRVMSSGNDCAFFEVLQKDVHLLSFYSDSAYDFAFGNDCAFFEVLQKLAYKKNDVHLLSFYSDSAYDSAIKDISQVSSLVKNRLVPDSFTKEGIKSLFQNNPNDVFIALAHTDRDDFVLKDSEGNELSISIKELEDIAGEFGCDIIFIGCKTAQSGVSIGTDKKFNSIKALEKLTIAHDKAQNYDEFFNMLIADDTFGLIFTRNALNHTARQRNIDINLYDQKPVFTNIIDESTYSSRIYAVLNEVEASTITSTEEDITVSPNPNSISRQSLIAILAASVLGFIFVFFGIKKFTKA
ncbi:MAG: hypothetical protein FWH27_10725, partial [Planctomycetaceae bacterium]|nr:hypothetical protein [Planctomycetaceae bacterium]